MKNFGFDKSIYRCLNESLFDDTDDILSNENTNSISDLYIDDDFLLQRFNELYSQQDLRKYNLIEYPIFSKIETYNINGTNYKFITETNKYAQYAVGYPTGIKYTGTFSYLITTQELMDFIDTYNIIIQYPVNDIKYGVSSYITYILNDITIPYDFLNNFHLYENEQVKQKSYSIGLVLNNCKIIENELISLLESGNSNYLNIKYVLLNKLHVSSLNLLNITYGYPLEITNCNQLTDLNINYNINNYTEGSLLIKSCKKLSNVEINDNSKMVQLLKLKIDKCPNINTNTLILPNHNTTIYNAQLFNNKTKQRQIKFRGDIVKQFYTELHPDYKYKYYQVGYKNMYWL